MEYTPPAARGAGQRSIAVAPKGATVHPNAPGVDEEAHCGAEVALLRPRHKPGGDEPRERPQPRPHRSANEMVS